MARVGLGTAKVVLGRARVGLGRLIVEADGTSSC